MNKDNVFCVHKASVKNILICVLHNRVLLMTAFTCLGEIYANVVIIGHCCVLYKFSIF